MPRFMNIFKSKEYKEGWQAGKSGGSEIDNTYSEAATSDNLKQSMGASPWWDTNYKPFTDWDQGRHDARYQD